MPLDKSGSKEAVGKNIKKLTGEGYPQKQAVAISLNLKRKKKNAAPSSGQVSTPGGTNTSVATIEGKKRYSDEDYINIRTPIFDEHVDEDGEVFDEARLRTIAEACNKRIAESDDLSPITLGHTSDNPDDKQPDVVGVADEFGVEPFEDRTAIYSTLHIPRELWKPEYKFYRKSIELWDDGVVDPVVLVSEKIPIDSIAILGAVRPLRDLGMLGKNQSKKYRYSKTVGEKHMTPEEMLKSCVEAIQALPEMAYLRELVEQHKKESYEKDGVDGEHDKEHVDVYEKDETEHEREDEKDELKDGERHDPKEEEELSPAKLRYQYDQSLRRYSKLAEEHKTLKSQVATLERKERIADRRADLLGLEQEGIVFELAEELETVADLDAKNYTKHVEKMRKRYSRAPIGVHIVPAERKDAETQDNPYDLMLKTYEKVNSKGGK